MSAIAAAAAGTVVLGALGVGWHLVGGKARPLNEAVFQRLLDADGELGGLLAGAQYARTSVKVAVAKRASEALADVEHPLWLVYATRAQRDLQRRLQRMLGELDALTAEANEAFVQRELATFAALFDSVESNPLTVAQRRSCVVNEDNNLVLAGAGTGKTSTMIGRAGYLLASGRARPDEILMLAYGRKAAEEMQERQDEKLAAWTKDGTPTIKTFHALGLEIIGQAEGRRPSLSPLAEDKFQFTKFIDEQVAECCDLAAYQEKMIRYCGSERFPYRNPFDFASMPEYYEYVRENELRTLRGEVVKSFEEVVVANFLSANGVRYLYEHPYSVDTSGPDYRQYKPDFYLPDYKVYVEHFALDGQGQPPVHFDGRKYLEGVEWKRKLHRSHGTKLVETYSYLKREGRLESHLAAKLEEAGVKLVPRPPEELLAELRESSEVSDFAALLGDFLTLFKQADFELSELRRMAAAHIDAARMTLLIDLFGPILEAYETELRENRDIDFADMIRRATKHVEEGSFRSPYRQILVDEFQDISRPRARLVLALRQQATETVTFGVGDDWQSIYRFTGSDIAYTRDFPVHFGPTVTTPLETTFRFNDQIGAVSSKFVLKNPAQIRKSIASIKRSGKPEVSLVRAVRTDDGLRLALDGISSRLGGYGRPQRARVLVLGRYNWVVDEWRSRGAKQTLKKSYPSIDIDFMTVHAAKGKEADYVVVLGLHRGKHGFPSEKPTDDVLEFLLPELEPFRHAEERRLFYVALTRAKERTYLVYSPQEASPFVVELLSEDDPYPVCTDEFAAELLCAEVPLVLCPKCADGGLVLKSGPYGTFVGCNNYPYCNYREKPCPQCGSLMRRAGSQRTCTNAGCAVTIPICPKCGAQMVERTGPYGRFWGCINYRRNSDFMCTGKINIERRRPAGSPSSTRRYGRRY